MTCGGGGDGGVICLFVLPAQELIAQAEGQRSSDTGFVSCIVTKRDSSSTAGTQTVNDKGKAIRGFLISNIITTGNSMYEHSTAPKVDSSVFGFFDLF